MAGVFIIAEAGVNHNGDLNLAEQLVDAAVSAGADAVKFQAFKAEELACKHAPKATYQLKRTEGSQSQYAMLKALELGRKSHRHIMSHCAQKKIEFLSSTFGKVSADLLDDLGVNTLKIPSGEITNLPLLEKISGMKKKIILSTGMATLEEIRFAIGILTLGGIPRKDLSLLHCCTQYPAPFPDANLSAITTMIDRFPDIRVGFSDHTLGIEAAIAAVALGARIIEKHFTLDKHLPGPDHGASLSPEELKDMVSAIRNIESALGNGIKQPGPSELENLTIVRKSIVAARDIRAGETFTEKNLTAKRPGDGLSPVLWYDVIGRIADRNFSADQQIVI